MSVVRNVVVGFGSLALFAVAACGGADPVSDFNGPAGGPTNKGTGNTGTISNTPAPASQPSADLAACATSTAAATAKPVTLVFAYDKSGSMKDNGKWGAAKDAMKAFFSSADAKGVSASLMFFPNGSNICSLGNYTSPQVPLTALPSGDFGTALDGVSPNGSTPTFSALSGAVSYATNLAQGSAKDSTVAVVLVTDGIPQGCVDDMDPSMAAGVAAGAAGTIPTYVVGVGDQLGSLNQIAQSGGTKSAFVVSVGNPTQTQQDLSAAISKIKSSALSCDYSIPAPPNGETFDRAKVNVQYTPASGSAASLSYNQSCTGGTGWKYDDATNPTRILACDSTCDQIKAATGKVDIVFGCATKDGSVN
jgi:hypothetical protein